MVIVLTIRTIARGTVGVGHLTHGIGARLGPGDMTRIGTEDGAIHIGRGVLRVRRITTITAMVLARLGIPLHPGPTDLTAQPRPAAPRGAVPVRCTTDIRLQAVECLVPAIWGAVVAIVLLRYRRRQLAPEDTLHRTPVHVLRPDIIAEVLADAMATAHHPPKAVVAHTLRRAARPHPAVAEAGRIAAVVEADRMVVVATVVATVEAEVEAVVVVDKAIGKKPPYLMNNKIEKIHPEHETSHYSGSYRCLGDSYGLRPKLH